MLLTGKNRGKRVITIDVEPPTLKNNAGYVDRVINTLKHLFETRNIRIALSLMRDIPKLVKKFGYKLKCIMFQNDLDTWSLIHVSSPEKPETITGLAIDIGTSCVSIQIIDLFNGNKIVGKVFDNPQINVGADILARIHYADTVNGLNDLNSMLIDSINKHIIDLTYQCNLNPDNIYMLSVAGNTTMTHLFIKMTPETIFKEPYTPAINELSTISAKEIGLLANANAQVFIFPNVGSYVGGDLIAGTLYSGIDKKEEISMLVDIGTNAEVILGNKNWMIACAGAAGPALEGSVTKMGKMAKTGIIDKVKINLKSKKVEVSTIGNILSKGICGSGLIDLVAQLFISGLIDSRGKFKPSVSPESFVEKAGSIHFIVVSSKDSSDGNNITISQVDINSLINSKAAMYSVLETIMHNVGIKQNDLKSFIIAGTFGLHINPKSAVIIGMIPDLPNGLYKPIGNSSLGGAIKFLCDTDSFTRINKIKNKITYIELNVDQGFMNKFSAAKFLPHTDISKFPTLKKAT